LKFAIDVSVLSNEERMASTLYSTKQHGRRRENSYELFSSPNIRRIMRSLIVRCAGHVACMGQTREAFKILVEGPEGKTTTLNTQTYVAG
jgi:hypothetical protein